MYLLTLAVLALAPARPIDVALLVSPDSAVVVTARGSKRDVAESQAFIRRVIGARPCRCPLPEAWTFLQVTGPGGDVSMDLGTLVVMDRKGRSYEPADPCAFGGSRSPFASPVALSFAYFGIRPEDVSAGVWRDSSGTTNLQPPRR